MKTKPVLTLLIIICINSFAFAQTFKFGTVNADVGVGGGFYVGTYNFPTKSGTGTYADFHASFPTLDAEFGLLKFLGVGVNYNKGIYSLASVGNAHSTAYGVTLNFHIPNRNEHFDLPIGVTYGLVRLRSSESIKYGSGPEHIYGDGIYLNVHILPHFYFGKYVGMFVGLEYEHKSYNKTEWLDVDGRVYDKASGFNFKMDGVMLRLGIAGRFNVMGNKK